MDEKKLKPGWRKVKFGEVVRLSKARCADPLAEGIERFVGLEHLEPGDLRIRSWGNVADGVTFTSVFQPGQVLFGKRRAYQRKVAVADFAGVCSGDIYVLESLDANVLLPELLPFICQTDAFFEHAVGTSAGSLSPRTNWTSLAGFEFALPPVEEQLRQVTVLLSIREVVEAYDELLEASSALSRSFAKDRLADTNWDAKPLRDVCQLIVDCKNRTPPYVDKGFPVIRTSNVRDGHLLESDLLQTTEDGYKKWTERATPTTNDLAFTREAPVGEVCLIPSGIQPCLGQRMMLFRANEKVLLPNYLLVAMLSPQMKDQLNRMSGGSTVGHIRVEDAKGLRIAVPPLQAQRNIASVFMQVRNSRELAARKKNNVTELLWMAINGGVKE